jgi:hypothetical protein
MQKSFGRDDEDGDDDIDGGEESRGLINGCVCVPVL